MGSTAVAAPKRKPVVTSKFATAKCSPRGESIRRCLVEGDAVELRLRISRNGGKVFLTLDELPMMTLQDEYVSAAANEKSILFTLKDNRLPTGHKLIVKTSSMTLTIKFDVVSTKSDSQVQVVRADQAQKDMVVEERVRARVAQLEKEHRAALNALDAKAARIARKHTLNQLQDNQGGRIIPPAGEVRAREDFLVFRALTSIRAVSYTHLTLPTSDLV